MYGKVRARFSAVVVRRWMKSHDPGIICATLNEDIFSHPGEFEYRPMTCRFEGCWGWSFDAECTLDVGETEETGET